MLILISRVVLFLTSLDQNCTNFPDYPSTDFSFLYFDSSLVKFVVIFCVNGIHDVPIPFVGVHKMLMFFSFQILLSSIWLVLSFLACRKLASLCSEVSLWLDESPIPCHSNHLLWRSMDCPRPPSCPQYISLSSCPPRSSLGYVSNILSTFVFKTATDGCPVTQVNTAMIGLST